MSEGSTVRIDLMGKDNLNESSDFTDTNEIDHVNSFPNISEMSISKVLIKTQKT